MFGPKFIYEQTMFCISSKYLQYIFKARVFTGVKKML